MIDWTKPVIRIGNGAPARVLCTDGPEPYPIAVWVAGAITPYALTRDGRLCVDDLTAAFANAPEPEAEPMKITLVVWKDGTSSWPGHEFLSSSPGRYFRITIPAPGKEPTIVEAK